MTRADILALPVGRGLDGLVATRVMGDSMTPDGTWVSGQDQKHTIRCEDGGPWKYSAEMNDAWRVHLVACSWLFSKRKRYLDAIQNQADQILHPEVESEAIHVSAPNVLVVLRDRMAGAICKAALIAAGGAR